MNNETIHSSFDYFFDLSDSLFNNSLINKILENNLRNFQATGYKINDSIVGFICNRYDNSDEYLIESYKTDTSKVITSHPNYYINPKIEMTHKEHESIFRIDRLQSGLLVLESFYADRDLKPCIAQIFIYKSEDVDNLLKNHSDEFKFSNFNHKILSHRYNIKPVFSACEKLNNTNEKLPKTVEYEDYVKVLNIVINEINEHGKSRYFDEILAEVKNKKEYESFRNIEHVKIKRRKK